MGMSANPRPDDEPSGRPRWAAALPADHHRGHRQQQVQRPGHRDAAWLLLKQACQGAGNPRPGDEPPRPSSANPFRASSTQGRPAWHHAGCGSGWWTCSCRSWACGVRGPFSGCAKSAVCRTAGKAVLPGQGPMRVRVPDSTPLHFKALAWSQGLRRKVIAIVAAAGPAAAAVRGPAVVRSCWHRSLEPAQGKDTHSDDSNGQRGVRVTRITPTRRDW